MLFIFSNFTCFAKSACQVIYKDYNFVFLSFCLHNAASTTPQHGHWPARGYYGTELFSVLFSSKNIPYRNFVPRKNTIRNKTVRNFFRIVIPYLSVLYFFNQFTSRKIQQETFSIAFLLYLVAYIFSYHEKAINAL